MELYLEIIEGPASGRKIHIRGKTSVGRNSADILINDPKLSGTHCFFELDPSGAWWVKDNDSRNGILVNGHKETKAAIKEGDIIKMGSMKIQCQFLISDSLEFSEKFQDWTKSLIKSMKNSENICREINPEIQLRVIQGPQYKHVWNIFYGPRYAGQKSFDICLYDEKAPVEAFKILVKDKNPYFVTKNEKIVKLNNKSVKRKQLKHGDVISFGDSQLLVEFDKDHGLYS